MIRDARYGKLLIGPEDDSFLEYRQSVLGDKQLLLETQQSAFEGKPYSKPLGLINQSFHEDDRGKKKLIFRKNLKNHYS